MRTVKRTYKTKHGVVTKTYTYGHASTRGKTLVGKSGKINKNNIESFIKAINDNPNFSDAEKRTTINDLNSLIRQRSKNGKKLTTTGFLGHREEEKVDRMLTNLGTSIEEASDILGIDIEDLRNSDNWDDNTFTLTDKDGNIISKYEFEFTYTGEVWKKIV